MRKSIFLLILFLFGKLFSISIISEKVSNINTYYIIIPYIEFSYQNVNDKFYADYEIKINVLDKKKNIVYKKIEQISIKKNFINDENWKGFSTKCDLQKNQKYFFHITLFNKNTGTKQKFLKEINKVKKVKSEGIFYLTLIQGKEKFVLVSNLEKAKIDSIEIFQNYPIQPDSLCLRYSDTIIGMYKNPLIPFQQKIKPFVQNMNLDSLRIDAYFSKGVIQSKYCIFSEQFIYSRLYSIKEQLLQLEYLLNSRQIKKMKQGDIKRNIEKYWASVDPTPDTKANEFRESFYHKIEYCVENFSVQEYLSGWKTDRARIYMKYGEPDEIFENSSPVSNFPHRVYPYIIWTYYIEEQEFIFQDKRGGRNYVLSNNWQD